MSQPTYRSAHKAVASIRGKASQYPCVGCCGQAQEWAYSHPERHVSLVDVSMGYSMVYSTDVQHYQPMCKPCHARLDWSMNPDRVAGGVPFPHGETHPSAKLTEAEVHAIRVSRSSNAVTGRKFGVSKITVLKIKHRRIWSHLEEII